MAFDFKLNLSVSLAGLNLTDGEPTMGDDWASKTAARIKEGEERKRQNEEQERHNRSLLVSHAPMLWGSLERNH
jgi:hypothetical protein